MVAARIASFLHHIPAIFTSFIIFSLNFHYFSQLFHRGQVRVATYCLGCLRASDQTSSDRQRPRAQKVRMVTREILKASYSCIFSYIYCIYCI